MVFQTLVKTQYAEYMKQNKFLRVAFKNSKKEKKKKKKKKKEKRFYME